MQVVRKAKDQEKSWSACKAARYKTRAAQQQGNKGQLGIDVHRAAPKLSSEDRRKHKRFKDIKYTKTAVPTSDWKIHDGKDLQWKGFLHFAIEDYGEAKFKTKTSIKSFINQKGTKLPPGARRLGNTNPSSTLATITQ